MDHLADIYVDRAVGQLDRPFTYIVPSDLLPLARVGQLVLVPLGAGRSQGVIRRIYPGAVLPSYKPILKIIDNRPMMSEQLLELAEWAADRYLSYVPQVIRAMVPKAVRNGETVRTRKVWYRVVKERRGRASRRQEVYDFIRERGWIDRQQLLEVFPTCQEPLRALLAEGALEVLVKSPQSFMGVSASYSLSEDQEEALREIMRHPHTPYLLEGVTGSGKTEVYLALIAHALKEGRQALVLLPEIALTPQTVARFRERFGDRVAVWHSGLTPGERYMTWSEVRDNEVAVVIGARSAVFLPFANLGVIVIDEEHESSYKQEDHPRYHTREVALWRGKHQDAQVILGSATPSLEVRYWADNGRIGYVQLPNRILGRPMPSVVLVDMREELAHGNRHIFSDPLQQALTQTLSQGDQAILFLNRRGYSTFVLCRSCGQALECRDCAVSLTFHQKENRLVCHYCLKSTPLPKRCPECGSDRIRYFGAGTERVVEDVQTLFPKARILRADRDTLNHPQDYADLYQTFAQHDADVLVGTQMIAKGMDFPDVTLVGIVAADTALHLPDFRSAERTFQLLVQAAGRSGRGTKPGTVVVQTYNPEHYAIAHALHHDYAAFYRDEIAYRQDTLYPPYAQLWLLVVETADERRGAIIAEEVRERLQTELPEADILGPAPAPLARVRTTYRQQLLVKIYRENPHTTGVLQKIREDFDGVNITRDPYVML